MKRLVLVALVFVCVFASLVYAQEENVTNVTEQTNVSCDGECSYIWGNTINQTWIPNIFTMTNIGNCSLTYTETDSIYSDYYKFICEISYMNLTDMQEFIFLFVSDLNSQIKDYQRNNTALMKENSRIPSLEFQNLVEIIAIIGLVASLVIYYLYINW